MTTEQSIHCASKWVAFALALVMFALIYFMSGCSTLTAYNSHVAAREDSISGYSKDNGSIGGAFSHRVEYR